MDDFKKIAKNLIVTATFSNIAVADVEKMINVLKVNFRDTVQNKNDEIIDLLVGLRRLIKNPMSLDIVCIINAAKTAFEHSYYRIANELLLYSEEEKCDDYICLKADILSISGEFFDASDLLCISIDDKNKDALKLMQKYGELLINNLPLSESARIWYLEDYIDKFSRYFDTATVVPEIFYYVGRCYEELFNCGSDEKNSEKAIYYLNYFIKLLYKIPFIKDEDKIKMMEAYWSMARIAENQYYTAANKSDSEKDNYINSVETNYEKAERVVSDFPVYKELTREYKNYFSKSVDENFNEELTSKIINSQEMRNIEKVYYHNESFRKQFISEKHRLQDKETPPCLHILQRWNSFTPILSDAKTPSRGGGYYIDTGCKGIVIDPGFNFIQNFREAGFFLNDIDYIFITHAHNDHFFDFESLTSLIYTYNNKEIKGDKYSYKKPNTIYQQILRKNPKKEESEIEDLVKNEYDSSPRRKKFTLVLTESTYEKFNDIIAREKKKKISDFNFMKAMIKSSLRNYPDSNRFPIKAANGKLIICGAIYAKHADLISTDHCVGFFFEHENTNLVYTGDTGFDDTIEKLYENIKRSSKNIILLAHIGGFKPKEKYNLYSRRKPSGEINPDAFYDYHLGRSGLSELVQTLNPDLCVISEFGEEFRGNCRIQLAKLYENKFNPAGKIGKKNVFIPADIGLKIQFDMTIKAIDKEYIKEGDMVTENYIDYQSIDYFEDNILSPEYPIYYFKKGVLKSNLLKSVLQLNDGKEIYENQF